MGFGPLPGSPDSSVVLVDGPWTHRIVRANGIALHVAELGTGPLVLLLHGFPQFWWAWHRQLRRSGRRRLPRRRRRPARVRRQRQAAARLRRTESRRRHRRAGDLARGSDAMVVGTDIGGLLAWTMAATHPQVVRSLAVLGAAHPLRLRSAVAPRPRPSGGRRRTRCALSRCRAAPSSCWRATRTGCGSCSTRGPARAGAARPATSPTSSATPRRCASTRSHYCAAEYFRWLVRSLPRTDGRRFAASLRTTDQRADAAAARRLRHLRPAGDGAGVGTVRLRRLRVARTRRRRALPAQRGARDW